MRPAMITIKQATLRRGTKVLLDTADGRAMARWGSFHGGGALAWWLKQRIDRRYVEQFRVQCDGYGTPPSVMATT